MVLRVSKCLKEYTSARRSGSAHQMVLLIDDNFQYRSLRKRFFHLATKAKCGFGLVYVNTPITTCRERNAVRGDSARVPDEVFERMVTVFEAPNGCQTSWEVNTWEVKQMEDAANIEEAMNALIQQASREGKKRRLAQMDAQRKAAQQHRDRLSTQQSVLHLVDLQLRQWISTQLQDENTLTSGLPKSQLAFQLNQRKKSYLASMIQSYSNIVDSIHVQGKSIKEVFMLLPRLRHRVPRWPSLFTLRSCSSRTNNNDTLRSTNVRVRYAPSPTGFLHLGGLRTALFNYLFAKSCGGQFILRIEDTDKTRQVEGSVEALVDSLKWCGVEEDEGPNLGGPYGPYIQSQRLPIYQEAAKKLIESGHAYRCFCTSERLQKLRESQTRHGEATMYDRACLGLDEKEVEERVARGEPYTIRLKIPDGKTAVKDMLRGYVQFDHGGIDDQVLMKSDGYPTYHLANVVDDHAMRISHVIRGEEWLPSTPKHVILYKALGYEAPTWAHLGLLLNEDRTKLSKRQGDVAVEDFRTTSILTLHFNSRAQDKGFIPSGLVNFVALLGWNPADGNNQEIFAMKELEKLFSIDHVNKAGSVVNVDRLRWINSRHVRTLFAEEVASDEHKLAVVNDVLLMISSDLEEVGLPSTPADVVEKFGLDYIWRAMYLMKERVSVLPEFGLLCMPFFTNPDLSSSVAQDMKIMYIDESTADLVADVCSNLCNLSDEEFTPDHITKSIKAVAKNRKLGLKKVLMPVRYYLTGMDVGAGLGDTIELLGLETVLRRLKFSEVTCIT
ncbi:hypothetical protein DD237_003312 [Peronospora effusa]|uniref:glutamate--tRNA ligase n=1 Tax=Peronospora effusa TaxID=542832 RepID=A0A425CAZ6_9STRA|nr:hypothetical protein DD237_003312 [Peronospora effusa]